MIWFIIIAVVVIVFYAILSMTIDLLRLTGHRKTLILNVVAKMVQNECKKLAFC
jgi:hypothetical protein